MGSKRAHSTCLWTPNSPKVSQEKHTFDPFLTDLWSQNSRFSRHFVTLEGPKWLAMGWKWSHFTCLCTPNGLGSFLEKHIVDPFLTHFWSQNDPFSRHFVTLEGPKWLAMGSKWAHFTCLGTQNGLGSFFGKTHFSPTFDPFFVPKQSIFKAFWDFRRAKTGHHELKTRQKHLFWHSMWSRVIFEKSHFFVFVLAHTSLGYLLQLAAAHWAWVRGSRRRLGQL